MNNIYVYRHRRLDNYKIFYIGIGSLKRSKTKSGRNNYWKNITNKTDYIVEIVAKNLSLIDAFELEIFLIEQYGKENLCNLTSGGEGKLGLKHSDEVKLKIGNSQKGKIIPNCQKIKMSIAKNGMYFLNENPNSKKVINTETKEIFNTLKEAAISINKNYSSFKWSIKNALNFNFKYYE